jgi:hypothetical protein
VEELRSLGLADGDLQVWGKGTLVGQASGLVAVVEVPFRLAYSLRHLMGLLTHVRLESHCPP